MISKQTVKEGKNHATKPGGFAKGIMIADLSRDLLSDIGKTGQITSHFCLFMHALMLICSA